MIADEGYGSLTMRALARASIMKLGALQYHFRTSEEMLRALVDYIAESYRRFFDALRNQHNPPGIREIVMFILDDDAGDIKSIPCPRHKKGPHREPCHSSHDRHIRDAASRLRARAKITSHFGIPSSGHLRPILNCEIHAIVLLFLWFRNFGSTKSDLNLDANSVKLFLREPLMGDPPPRKR